MPRGNKPVVVVSFGGQYAHLISRRVRDLGAFTEVIPYTSIIKEGVGVLENSSAIILSGGPASVSDLDMPIEDFSELIMLGKPILGICFGHQLLAKILGGEVSAGVGEYGRTEVKTVRMYPILDGWGEVEEVWMSHKDHVTSLPESAQVLMVSGKGYIAAFRVKGELIYGVQFHPEVKHTPKGDLLLRNFLKLAHTEMNWTPVDMVEELIREVREAVRPPNKAIMAVSGGVDSTVAAVIAKKALGNRLIAVLVDHGLFREGEVQEVLQYLREVGLDPIVIDAEKRFLTKLEGIRDCELRRKLIGEEFARVFQELVGRDPNIKYLVQGTTYPDVIESGAEEGADRIKSHHNVAAMPEWFGLKLIEPLRYLYKDEVRKVGEALGLPKRVIKRHPFPGPGLAVRIVGDFTLKKLLIARRASRILEEELMKEGSYYDVWQAFAVVGDDKWVGIKGDRRKMGYVVTLRIVSSEDAMTADWVRVGYEFLDRVSRRITSEIDDVTMVTYAVTSKPPSTIEPC